jgi:hypothetical protein
MDGLVAVNALTLTAHPSRSTQRTGPAVLLFLGSPQAHPARTRS